MNTWTQEAWKLYEDESNMDLWSGSRNFKSFCEERPGVYGSANTIARHLRLARLYRKITEDFREMGIPELRSWKSTISAKAFDQISRIYDFMDQTDREQIAIFLRDGHLGAKEIREILSVYEAIKPLIESRGRPRLEATEETKSLPDEASRILKLILEIRKTPRYRALTKQGTFVAVTSTRAHYPELRKEDWFDFVWMPASSKSTPNHIIAFKLNLAATDGDIVSKALFETFPEIVVAQPSSTRQAIDMELISNFYFDEVQSQEFSIYRVSPNEKRNSKPTALMRLFGETLLTKIA